MNKTPSKTNKKKSISELTKLKALIKLNRRIDNGQLIRQSMKYHYVSIHDWCKAKTKSTDRVLPISEFKSLFTGIKSDVVKNALIKWINEIYHPTAFLTIQLPDNLKTENIDKAKEHLRLAMSHFEKQLLGRDWIKYHLPFICFMEEGISGCWHFHILFNQGKFKPWHLWLALDNTLKHFEWSDYCMHLDIITADKVKAISYCLKEIGVNINGHFDSNRFIFSDELFKLCN